MLLSVDLPPRPIILLDMSVGRQVVLTIQSDKLLEMITKHGRVEAANRLGNELLDLLIGDDPVTTLG